MNFDQISLILYNDFVGMLFSAVGLFVFRFTIFSSIFFKLVFEIVILSLTTTFSVIFIILGCLLNLIIL